MKDAVKFPWRSAAILLLPALLAACGQRGPLYLSEQSDGTTVEAAAPQSEDEDKDSNDPGGPEDERLRRD